MTYFELLKKFAIKTDCNQSISIQDGFAKYSFNFSMKQKISKIIVPVKDTKKVGVAKDLESF